MFTQLANKEASREIGSFDQKLYSYYSYGYVQDSYVFLLEHDFSHVNTQSWPCTFFAIEYGSTTWHLKLTKPTKY